MKRIVVIGAGFGGLSVAEKLAGSIPGHNVILVDKKKTSDFLPALPDTIGRNIRPQYLSYELKDFTTSRGITFINEEVLSLDLGRKEVRMNNNCLGYDYLVIASGSETNFYGNDNIRENAYKLDDTEDARLLVSALKTGSFDNFIVCGGGYTGVEVATNLQRFLEKNGKNGRVMIIERASSILGPLPAWMKEYTVNNLKSMGVEMLLNATIDKIEGRQVHVSKGLKYENCLVVWAGGVKTAGFIQTLDIDKNPQGRIKVDEFLRISDNCFAIGDAAEFFHKGAFLRMAVQFSIFQGYVTAENIKRSIRGLQLKKYCPLDMGFIIPMANNRSCGNVLGINIKGFAATFLHYLMCIYRSNGPKNKLGLIRNLIVK